MRQITALIVLFLLIAPIATADEKADKTPANTATSEEIVKLDADEIFALVEQVLKNPKMDRAAARAFLQNALDGKVTLFRLDVAIDEGSSICEAKSCRSKLCRRCDIVTSKCYCSSCCLAAAP